MRSLALAALLLAGCGGGPLAVPASSERTREATTFRYDYSERNPALERAEREARAMWATIGAVPPAVSIFIGTPPSGYDGLCYCSGPDPVILVRRPSVAIVAHELGHAMGLGHVAGDRSELMRPVITLDATIGPATLAEYRKKFGPPLAPGSYGPTWRVP